MSDPGAFALAQVSAIRASMSLCVLVQRFCVLRPSVSRMMIFLVGMPSLVSIAGALSGAAFDIDCQAHCSPTVWLVLPFGNIASTLLLSAVQSYVIGSNDSGQLLYWSG